MSIDICQTKKKARTPSPGCKEVYNNVKSLALGFMMMTTVSSGEAETRFFLKYFILVHTLS